MCSISKGCFCLQANRNCIDWRLKSLNFAVCNNYRQLSKQCHLSIVDYGPFQTAYSSFAELNCIRCDARATEERQSLTRCTKHNIIDKVGAFAKTILNNKSKNVELGLAHKTMSPNRRMMLQSAEFVSNFCNCK